jgi:transposase
MATLAKELLREMHAAHSFQAARWKLVAFYQCAADADVPELTRLARTVANWEIEILNNHVTGISNGPTESQNLIAEKLRRIGHGMRNFENYRLRLLLHSGVQWNTQPTARTRGRHPRLVA